MFRRIAYIRVNRSHLGKPLTPGQTRSRPSKLLASRQSAHVGQTAPSGRTARVRAKRSRPTIHSRPDKSHVRANRSHPGKPLASGKSLTSGQTARVPAIHSCPGKRTRPDNSLTSRQISHVRANRSRPAIRSCRAIARVPTIHSRPGNPLMSGKPHTSGELLASGQIVRVRANRSRPDNSLTSDKSLTSGQPFASVNRSRRANHSRPGTARVRRTVRTTARLNQLPLISILLLFCSWRCSAS